MIELQFNLDVDDDWPPVPVEVLPCIAEAGGYKVTVAPLFIKDLSAGDTISVVRDSAGHVTSWKHITKSRRSTIWLLRLEDIDHLDEVLAELRLLNCNTIKLPQFGCYAIDVPPECPIGRVDECLARLDNSQVAIAYPSLRHQDN
jgi:hypothetical protein